MHSIKVKPKYNSIVNPRVGIIALATDFRIEKDFITVIKNMDVDLFVNRIHCYFPLTSENLIKMSSTVTDVSKDILPNEKLDCVVYGCTSGTIAAGYETIKKKINLAKPEAKVTTPSSAAINALKKGKSLLAAGIKNVNGKFNKGDHIKILDKNMKEYARGLSSFTSDEISKIKGQHSNKISELLGYITKSEVIHKDDMVEI